MRRGGVLVRKSGEVAGYLGTSVLWVLFMVFAFF